MNSDPLTVTPDARICDAARLACEGDIRGLPVVRDQMLVGLVTPAALLKHLIDLLAE